MSTMLSMWQKAGSQSVLDSKECFEKWATRSLKCADPTAMSYDGKKHVLTIKKIEREFVYNGSLADSFCIRLLALLHVALSSNFNRLTRTPMPFGRQIVDIWTVDVDDDFKNVVEPVVATVEKMAEEAKMKLKIAFGKEVVFRAYNDQVSALDGCGGLPSGFGNDPGEIVRNFLNPSSGVCAIPIIADGLRNIRYGFVVRFYNDVTPKEKYDRDFEALVNENGEIVVDDLWYDRVVARTMYDKIVALCSVYVGHTLRMYNPRELHGIIGMLSADDIRTLSAWHRVKSRIDRAIEDHGASIRLEGKRIFDDFDKKLRAGYNVCDDLAHPEYLESRATAEISNMPTAVSALAGLMIPVDAHVSMNFFPIPEDGQKWELVYGLPLREFLESPEFGMVIG